MNNRAFTISVVLAIAAALMIWAYIDDMEKKVKNQWGTETRVWVAKRDIDELAEIHENMITQKSMPKKFVDPGAVSDPKEVVGFIATVPIRKGEQITLNKVITAGVKTGLSKQITPGKRAVAIPVEDKTAVNRLIKPGDRIDIVATIEPPGAQKGNQITKVILQDVAVLAVGEFITAQAPRKSEKDDLSGKELVRNLNTERNFSTITIETEPQTAAQIALLVGSNSSLSILLRNNDDTDRISMGPITLSDVLGGDSSRGARGTATQR